MAAATKTTTHMCPIAVITMLRGGQRKLTSASGLPNRYKTASSSFSERVYLKWIRKKVLKDDVPIYTSTFTHFSSLVKSCSKAKGSRF